jgi:uncharacterized protein
MTDKTVWVLLDDRAGNKGQTIGVAQALKWPYEIKNIVYDKWVKLPNILRGASVLGIQKECLTQIKPPYPDFVISAGRRLYPLSRYIRKISGKKTKIIHLMNPGAAGFRDAFLIALPKHDGYHGKSKNVFETIGAPHKVTPLLLDQEKKKWEQTLEKYPSPRISLIVGGSTKDSPFTLEMAKTFVQKVRQIPHGSFLVTTSRRTPEEVVSYMEKELSGEKCFFYKGQADMENPYFGLLSWADTVVVTGDSISMCAEACATGKPVYIFTESMRISEKHQRFHQELYSLGKAAPLGSPTTPSGGYLNAAEEVAEKVFSMLS